MYRHWLLLNLLGCYALAVAGDSARCSPSQEEIVGQEPACSEEDMEPAEPIHKPIPLGSVLHSECERLGSPVVKYTIGTDGRVKDLVFLRSSRCKKADDELRRCHVEWRYKAASCHGDPVVEERMLAINWGYGPPPAKDIDHCPPYESTHDAADASETSETSDPREYMYLVKDWYWKGHCFHRGEGVPQFHQPEGPDDEIEFVVNYEGEGKVCN